MYVCMYVCMYVRIYIMYLLLSAIGLMPGGSVYIQQGKQYIHLTKTAHPTKTAHTSHEFHSTVQVHEHPEYNTIHPLKARASYRPVLPSVRLMG
jgi:uncharacterized short protein YbdD (DUF466 family)